MGPLLFRRIACRRTLQAPKMKASHGNLSTLWASAKHGLEKNMDAESTPASLFRRTLFRHIARHGCSERHQR
eukprot:5625745-Amphidinium_carterae.1